VRFLIVVGLVWAFTEIAFGTLVTANCPRGMTGSVLAGTSMLFISAAYYSGAGAWLLLPLGLTVAVKALGAAALGRSVLSGAVLNPSYAYATEVLALVVVVALVGARRMTRLPCGAAAGALTGLLAANLFLPVGHLTGFAACIHTGSGLPLAIYYAPVAAGISVVAVPLGHAVGCRAITWMGQEQARALSPRAVLNAASVAALVAVVAAQMVFT